MLEWMIFLAIVNIGFIIVDLIFNKED